jgi:hypothetical protein
MVLCGGVVKQITCTLHLVEFCKELRFKSPQQVTFLFMMFCL